MDIDEVPEGHWMLLDKQNNVLFHNKNCGTVAEEGHLYPLGDVFIQKKISHCVFQIKKKREGLWFILLRDHNQFCQDSF